MTYKEKLWKAALAEYHRRKRDGEPTDDLHQLIIEHHESRLEKPMVVGEQRIYNEKHAQDIWDALEPWQRDAIERRLDYRYWAEGGAYSGPMRGQALVALVLEAHEYEVNEPDRRRIERAQRRLQHPKTSQEQRQKDVAFLNNLRPNRHDEIERKGWGKAVVDAVRRVLSTPSSRLEEVSWKRRRMGAIRLRKKTVPTSHECEDAENRIVAKQQTEGLLASVNLKPNEKSALAKWMAGEPLTRDEQRRASDARKKLRLAGEDIALGA